MIRIDEIWLSTQPLDMRAGMDTVMAQVLRAFGYIKPHCAYLFCNTNVTIAESAGALWTGHLAVCPAAGTGKIPLG
ncbi:IS66 family insertion sequence element accessory protein TnpB [Acinetobacter pseudolwoffii]|nr:IS66 family insertion sequence element accessory protein TnpB [Acinetobacter pseudolwoffii]MCO8092346.1 IS66 family insertion sequence element accessory protein TnpB [Acinetobacter pseudolwoffii]